MTQLSTEHLSDLIAKRHVCLTQMRDLGQKQTELIVSGDMASLLRLLSAKNQLIAAVQTLEQELAPYHEQDPEQREWCSEVARQNSAKQAQECSELLSEIMELERQNEQRMTARRDEVAHQLQAAQAASTARNAYQAHQQHSIRKPLVATPESDAASSTSRLDIQSNL